MTGISGSTLRIGGDAHPFAPGIVGAQYRRCCVNSGPPRSTQPTAAKFTPRKTPRATAQRPRTSWTWSGAHHALSCGHPGRTGFCSRACSICPRGTFSSKSSPSRMRRSGPGIVPLIATASLPDPVKSHPGDRSRGRARNRESFLAGPCLAECAMEQTKAAEYRRNRRRDKCGRSSFARSLAFAVVHVSASIQRTSAFRSERGSKPSASRSWLCEAPHSRGRSSYRSDA